jgi:hypothetical protein
MGVTVGTTQNFDLSKPSPQDNVMGHLECITTITFDNSYPSGGEALTASDFGMSEIYGVSVIGDCEAYQYSYDQTNGKLKVYFQQPLTGVVTDDDSASSNGTAVLAQITDDPGHDWAFLNSTTANNADAMWSIGGEEIFVDDNDTPVGVAIYFDEDATDPARRFLCVNAENKDLFVPLGKGAFLVIADDDSAAATGVAVYFDDNGASVPARMLFISPTNTDGSFETFGEVPNGTDLSALAIRACVYGA